MRQVPKYLIIGSSRMARHFCYHLENLIKLGQVSGAFQKDNGVKE